MSTSQHDTPRAHLTAALAQVQACVPPDGFAGVWMPLLVAQGLTSALEYLACAERHGQVVVGPEPVAATFLYRQGQVVRWACVPHIPCTVIQQRWTVRDILGPVVEYLIRNAMGAGTWVAEPDLAPWDETQVDMRTSYAGEGA